MTRPWQRAADVLWRDSVGSVVLLPPEAVDPLVLRGTGATIWRLLEEPETVDTLAATLAPLYEVDAAGMRDDIESYLLELHRCGVLEAAS